MSKVFLRIFGIVFFMFALAAAIPVLARNIDSFAFFVASPDLGWGLFYVFTGFLLCTFFLFALFSTGTAAIFAGGQGYTQSVWNCGIYSLVSVAFFTTLLLLTGITEDEQEILLVCEIALMALILYNAIVFFCLRKEENFYWKNLLPSDPNTKLCLKVYALMIAIIEIASFLISHKFVE